MNENIKKYQTITIGLDEETIVFDSARPDITHTYIVRVDGVGDIPGAGFTSQKNAISELTSMLQSFDKQGRAASGRVRRIVEVTS